MKKNILIAFLCLTAFTISSQNAYQTATKLDANVVAELKKNLKKITENKTYFPKYPKEERKQLEDFLKFLDDPFADDIDVVRVGKVKDLTSKDTDGDGVPDNDDPCPEDPKNECTNKDDNENKDVDGDGVVDKDDKCSAEPGSIYNEGCPFIEGDENYLYHLKLNNLKSEIVDVGINDFGAGKALTDNNPGLNLIDIVTDFAVERTKKEIALTFFDNFGDKLWTPITIKDNDKVVLSFYLKDIFPDTFSQLDIRDSYTIPSLGEVWITAFQRDINNLPFNTIQLLRNDADFIKTDVGRYTVGIFDLITDLKKGLHPSLVLENLSKTFNNYDLAFDRYLGYLNLISNNVIKLENNTRKWVAISDLTNLTSEQQKYFLGYLYQVAKTKGSEFIDNTTFFRDLKSDNYNAFFDNVKFVVSEVQKLKSSLQSIKASQVNSDSYKEKYLIYLNQVVKTFNQIIETDIRGGLNIEIYNTDFFNVLITLSNDLVSFLGEIKEGKYGQSLLTTISLLKKVFKDKSVYNLLRDLSFYGNFLVDIINASKNDKVDASFIIEKYAAPVGSYKIKRKSRRSIDLNAYTGMNLSYEFSSESGAFSYGLTAPIGVNFAWKSDNKLTTSGSHSLFVSVVDIAAPFSYRLSNEDDKGLPENITWEQIFSPGIFYVWGFRNSPFSISIGGQYKPLLRKFGDLRERNILSANVSLVVDIPIFNLKKAE